MPHRCMNCGNKYEDDAEELIEGCECGSTLFLYKKDVEDRDTEELQEEKQSVMDEIDSFIRDVKNRVTPSANIEFDMESIRVEEDGVYEINLRKLLEEAPLIVELDEGSYRLHLASAFTQGKEKGLRVDDLDVDGDLKDRLEAADR